MPWPGYSFYCNLQGTEKTGPTVGVCVFAMAFNFLGRFLGSFYNFDSLPFARGGGIIYWLKSNKKVES
jgi:hypothetical protein